MVLDPSMSSKTIRNGMRHLDNLNPRPGQVLDQDFTLFNLTNLPWITPDFLASPYAGLDTGSLELIYAGNKLSKAQLLKCFLDMSKGQYLKLDRVFTRRRVRACVLVPESSRGHLSLSGESVPVESVGIEAHPAAMRVCAPEWLDEQEWQRIYEKG